MATLATGCIALWAGGSLWTFDVDPGAIPTRRTDEHSHHAIQLTLAVDGAYRLSVGGADLEGPAALVAPDTPHVFEPRGLVALLFIEPESPAGAGSR